MHNATDDQNVSRITQEVLHEKGERHLKEEREQIMKRNQQTGTVWNFSLGFQGSKRRISWC